MLSVTSYQGNANQSHKEVPPPTYEVWLESKRKKTVSVGEDVGKLEPSDTAVGLQNGAATLQSTLGVPQIVKYKVITWPSDSSPRCRPQRIENRESNS